jgi:hypothetical protein
MVPPWTPDPVAPEGPADADDGQPQGDPTYEETPDNGTQAPPATPQPVAPPARFRGARLNLGKLITTLLEAKEERSLLRLRASLRKLDLLILDELGYVPASKAGAELLFDVIATAYECQSVIVTSNLPFENWTEVLGSERLTGAALDRLTHRCQIIETKGESYRLQDAKRRQRKAPSKD